MVQAGINFVNDAASFSDPIGQVKMHIFQLLQAHFFFGNRRLISDDKDIEAKAVENFDGLGGPGKNLKIFETERAFRSAELVEPDRRIDHSVPIEKNRFWKP